jgi:hypothetical protein
MNERAKRTMFALWCLVWPVVLVASLRPLQQMPFGLPDKLIHFACYAAMTAAVATFCHEGHGLLRWLRWGCGCWCEHCGCGDARAAPPRDRRRRVGHRLCASPCTALSTQMAFAVVEHPPKQLKQSSPFLAIMLKCATVRGLVERARAWWARV